MGFLDILDLTAALLERDGRVSYRAIKRIFDLDDGYLEDVKRELIQIRRLAVDQGGEMLVWAGDLQAALEAAPRPTLVGPPPLAPRGFFCCWPVRFPASCGLSQSARDCWRLPV
jgi:hypothetical protein